MLDFDVPAKATLVGTLAAAVVMWFSTRGTPRARRGAGWAWAVGAGIVVAGGVTGAWPHWPPREDRARFLTLIVPLTLVVETIATTVQWRRMIWSLRVGLAALVTPILLYQSVYLAAWHGHQAMAQWSAPVATIVLCALGATLALVWLLLSALAARTSPLVVHGVLLVDAVAAAVTVMLSGYFGAGLLGLGLSGAIAGATLVAWLARQNIRKECSLGMSLIGVFAVVIMGRFFGALPTALAACLVLAPLAAWLFELPRARALAPRWREAGRFACVVVLVSLVVLVAQQRFTAAYNTRSGQVAPGEPGPPR